MAGATRWLDGFYALRPDDVTREDVINFDTARAFTLRYDNDLRITYENVGAATVIWSRMRAETGAAASAEAKALAKALNTRFNGWALRFQADHTPILLAARRDLDSR